MIKLTKYFLILLFVCLLCFFVFNRAFAAGDILTPNLFLKAPKQSIKDYTLYQDKKNNELIEYYYTTDRLDQPTNEIIDKRTDKARFFEVAPRSFKAVFYSSPVFYSDFATGLLYQLRTATTTLSAWNQQFSLLDKLRVWLVKTAYATVENFESGLADSRRLFLSAGSWAGVHDATDAESSLVIPNNTENTSFCYGGYKSGATYYLRRVEIAFDTSSFPDDASISAATINVYVGTDNSDTDTYSCDVLDNTNNGSLSHPLVVGNWDDFGSTPIGSETFANLMSGAPGLKSISLLSFTAISKTATTYLGFRTSGDIGNSAPTGGNLIAQNTGTAGDDPYLAVTYGAEPEPTPGPGIATSTGTGLNSWEFPLILIIFFALFLGIGILGKKILIWFEQILYGRYQ